MSSNPAADQREARGQKCQEAARAGLFGSTHEVSEAPDHDDAVRERIVSGSSGSKSGNKKPDVSKQQEAASVKGHHSGRAVPSKMKMGGDEFDHASNGGELNAQNAVRK
jgi:hypothetical protein